MRRKHGSTERPFGAIRQETDRAPRYACSYNHNRGSTICDNNRRELIERIDAPVLSAIERTVLTPEAVDYVIERALRLVAERQRQDPDHRGRLEGELKRVRSEPTNLLDLAAQGTAPTSVLEEITKREARITLLQDEHSELEHTKQVLKLNDKRLRKEMRDRMARFSELMHDNVPRARQALRKLLNGPVNLTPMIKDGRKTYSFEGETTVGPLLPPELIRMASPRGFERYKSRGDGLPALPFEGSAGGSTDAE